MDSCLLPYLVLLWGRGEFFAREMLDAPTKPEGITRNRFLIIERC